MNLTQVLIEILKQAVIDNPTSAHIVVSPPMDSFLRALPVSFEGTYVAYEEDGKIHTAYFIGDNRPFADERETDTEGQYRANREASSLIAKKMREGTLRLIFCPCLIEWFGPTHFERSRHERNAAIDR